MMALWIKASFNASNPPLLLSKTNEINNKNKLKITVSFFLKIVYDNKSINELTNVNHSYIEYIYN